MVQMTAGEMAADGQEAGGGAVPRQQAGRQELPPPAPRLLSRETNPPMLTNAHSAQRSASPSSMRFVHIMLHAFFLMNGLHPHVFSPVITPFPWWCHALFMFSAAGRRPCLSQRLWRHDLRGHREHPECDEGAAMGW